MLDCLRSEINIKKSEVLIGRAYWTYLLEIPIGHTYSRKDHFMIRRVFSAARPLILHEILILTCVKPFQSRDVISNHTFNSVLHMLQFLGGWKCLTLSSPKKL
jgi:hypothetical protein